MNRWMDRRTDGLTHSGASNSNSNSSSGRGSGSNTTSGSFACLPNLDPRRQQSITMPGLA